MIDQPKRLRSLTIVPDALYVAREADRQLSRVIDEMGRPAYILVARQMGKTNLLLHMKRSRELAGDVVCYFDLSTRHPNLQSFFRAIIDTVAVALDCTENLDQIAAERRLAMEPNVEFDIHMRLLLEAGRPSRLIVVLDEIDSLIGIPYSDKVLSQIRTMYFTRDNHRIYDLLTYVLSGVAEPTDLIKDKNISPFNIGEKIYLENFTLSELNALLNKASLRFPPIIVERIFYWTFGNPRMSWDLCAMLEDIQRAAEHLTIGTVDQAVERLYLRDFDRAPVDHVRTLVRSDPGLRDALMSIHYSKADTLDDVIRRRLFLAGITSSSRNVPDFQNRIVAKALSTEWLSQVSSSQVSTLETASRLYVEHDHDGAVRMFESYLEEFGDTESGLDQTQFMQFGIALFHIQRFGEAQRRLETALSVSDIPELRTPILFYLASAKLRSGDPEASIPLFEDVAAKPGEFEHLAKLALAGALVSSSARTNAQRIIGLSEEIIRRDNARSDEAATEITVSAYYNRALAHLASENRDLGLESLHAALAIAPHDLVPGIYLKLIDVLDIRARQIDALSHVVTLLESSLPMARRYGSTALSFSNFTLGALAAKALQIGDNGAAERLISLAMKSMGEPSVGRIAVKILTSTQAEVDHAALRSLIEIGLETGEKDELAPADILTLAKASVMSADLEGKQATFERYVRIVQSHRASFVFEEIDGLICISLASAAANGLNHVRMREVINFFDAIRETFLRSQSVLYAVYLNIKLTYFKLARQTSAANRSAQEIIDICDGQTAADSGLADPAFRSLVEQIQSNARNTLKVTAPDRFRKIGRNQLIRYRDKRSGAEKLAKFKKVEAELRSGQYELIAPNLEDL
jgi:tetratricopeptide (TPR) repeat protein